MEVGLKTAASIVSQIRPFTDPRHLLGRLTEQRELLWRLAQRDVEQRYRGSYLGILWALLNPLATLAVYTLVFGVVFKASWSVSETDGLVTFAIAVFTGMTAYSVLSESLVRAPGLVTASSNYVKRVVFPLEILPVTVVYTAVFHSLISVGIITVSLLLTTGTVPWTVLFLPLVYVPLVGLTLGLCWFTAALGVFVRDLGNATTVFVQLLFFLTPIVYPLSSVPAALRPLLRLNPLTPIVQDFRRVLLMGLPPDWPWFIACTALSAVVALAGYACFMSLRPAFADVI
jgi:lipopolysaccharide transport system permease protein